MAKRFIDTKMWDKAWFRRLTPKYKAVWLYLLTRCDHAGIWDADWEAAEFLIGEKVTYEELPAEIKSKLKYIEGENQYFIPSFVEFQYGELKENLTFSAKYLKDIFMANKEAKSGSIEMSDRGILSTKFENDGFVSEYYLLKISNIVI